VRRVTALVVPVHRSSRSVSSHVGAIHSWNVRHSRKLQKNIKTYFGGSRSFKVINADTIKKLVTSAC